MKSVNIGVEAEVKSQPVSGLPTKPSSPHLNAKLQASRTRTSVGHHPALLTANC